MKCECCISYNRCKEKDLLFDKCPYFLDEKSVVQDGDIDILPCPLCGNEAVVLENIEDGMAKYQVRCSTTYCAAKTENFIDIECALSQWNTRDIPIIRQRCCGVQ